MAKLMTMSGTYIPREVEFYNSAGELKQNSELSETEQVKTSITYATLGQKDSYLQSYAEAQKGKSSAKIKTDVSYDVCLKKHVKSIDNLEDDKGVKITNGFQLVSCLHPALNDLKQDLFYRICGIGTEFRS